MASPECVAQTSPKPLPYLTGQRPRSQLPPENSPVDTLLSPSVLDISRAGNMHSCIVVSISGGQAAGKKSVQAAVAKRLQELSGGRLRIACLQMGDFVKELNDADKISVKAGSKDMDCINAYDLDSLVSTIQRIRDGKDGVKIPKWNPNTLEREEDVILATKNDHGEEGSTDILIVEGCYMLCERRLVQLSDIKLFVDLNADERLGRRVVRDTEERGIALERVFDQYVKFGKRAFEERIEPSKSRADVILPKGVEGAAVDLVALSIWDDINARADAASYPNPAGDGRKPSLVGRTLGLHNLKFDEMGLERFYEPI